MSGLRPVPDRAGDGRQHAFRLRALRHRAQATRADPTGHCLALTFASLVLFAVLWLSMLMKVSTAGIVHETSLLSGPAELVRHGLWPLAIAVAFTTALATARQVRGHTLRADRSAHADPAAQPAWSIPHLPSHGDLGNARGPAAGGIRRLYQAGRPGDDPARTGSLCVGILTVVVVWAELSLDPQAVWEEIERRGQTHAPMPAAAPLEYRPGAASCEDCKLVCVPAEHDGRCPRCGRTCMSASPTA